MVSDSAYNMCNYGGLNCDPTVYNDISTILHGLNKDIYNYALGDSITLNILMAICNVTMHILCMHSLRPNWYFREKILAAQKIMDQYLQIDPGDF